MDSQRPLLQVHLWARPHLPAVKGRAIGVYAGSYRGEPEKVRAVASAQWNIFLTDTIRQNIEAQDAVQEQALLAYESAILTSLEKVENALTNQQIREQALAKSASATSKAARIARSQYEDGGLTTFLDVLDAERSRLNSEDALATSRATIVSNLVRLYRTLGGGWESVSPRPDATVATNQ